MTQLSAASGRRAPMVVAGFALLVTVIVLPFAHKQLGATASFVPALLAVVACFDLMSVYLLVGDYRDNGDVRMLAMSWAYLWSLAVMFGYALAFPGVMPHPPLASAPSVAPYLYVLWHVGFPVLLGLAWAPWPKRMRTTTNPAQRLAVAQLTCAWVLVIAGVVVAAVSIYSHHLPVLIRGLNTSRMTSLTAPIGIPLVVMALASTWHGLRNRSGPERWTAVSVLVCLCDLVLTYSSHFRFAAGWYAGRALTGLGAGLVLMAMLASFRRLKAAAEHAAATDALTGVANRRTLESTLSVELLRASRTRGSTAVLSLDLDGFKAVNDEQGHAAGDEILQRAVEAWSAQLRAGDFIARIGGDEFVAVLIDADDARARSAATRLVGATPSSVGVSIGVAIATKDIDVATLLAAADRDMYAVKSLQRHERSQVPQQREG